MKSNMNSAIYSKTRRLIACTLTTVGLLLSQAINPVTIAADAGDTTAPALKPAYLRCEYRVDPMGVDNLHPRLSWIVKSHERAQIQTAYQVRVASSPENLEAGNADLWDTGQVRSDKTTSIEYRGKPLVPDQRCYWQVRVWDRNNNASAWSDTAMWSMGLLNKSDWKAEWIGYDKRREISVPEVDFEGAKWIWFKNDQGPNFPAGVRVFAKDFVIPADTQIKKAELRITADDKFSFNLNGEQFATSEPVPDAWERPQIRDLTERINQGKNIIRVRAENTTASPAGLLVKFVIHTTDGKTINIVSDETWTATDQPGANWHNRSIADEAWPSCRTVGNYGAQPWGKLKGAKLILPPAAYLRTTFNLDKPVKKATLYATAFGWVDTYLNGKRVTNDRFNPGWTDYTKRIYYRAYDVTGSIDKGKNAFGAVIDDGWYSGYIGWGHVRDHYGKNVRFLGQIIVEFIDGTTKTIASNPDWKAATGPVQEADILMGETYDARRELTGWCTAGYDDSNWTPVDTGKELDPVIEWHPGPAVKVFKEIKPVSITEPTPGKYVLDLGQNFAGVVRLKIEGERGQKITLRHAERLNPDGTVYTTNLRTARAQDTYICKGDGVEVWEPRFTFHGFQYVEISGLKHAPSLDTITGLPLASATPVAGEFECSNPMLNKLHSNIFWTQLANFIDIPTDCPQRDERLGWTGDAQVYVRTATLNCDVQAFFTKWLTDLEDGQREDGQFPMVAPVKVAGNDGGPAWADAGTICPWTIYEVYGDQRVLERHYDAMQRFIEFRKNRSTAELLPPEDYHCFGDWLNINADTPKDIIYMAYFAHSVNLTAKAAKVLGRDAEADEYTKLRSKIISAFNKAYIDENGRIEGDTQTCYVLALAYDLVSGRRAELAAQRLIELIEERDWHLSTGFVGTKDLMLVLSKIGRNDVAYRLLLNDTFPSWGFSIKHGATSIWERWDGWTPENGFQDPGMNSFAHYSFGAVYQWMAENIGGIRNASPSYKKIIIKPYPNGDLEFAKVRYDSIRGRIQTNWKKENNNLILGVIIPANTTAIIHIPADSPEDINEGEKPLADVKGIEVLGQKDGRVIVEAGSGRYKFTIKNR